MRKVKILLTCFPLLALLAVPSNSQSALMPLVSIEATQPHATWAGDTGTFTLFRNGPTNQILNVFYLISGTATNGVDYTSISSWSIIPAGVQTSTVSIKPINNGQTNIGTVVLKLSPSPTGLAQNYQIGTPSVATVYITPADVTNLPPAVKLFAPTNGAVFHSPTVVQLGAFASDSDGSIASVEFFAGTQSLGVVSNGAIVDPPFPDGAGPGTQAFFLNWSNPVPGTYLLTALATDNGGASATSSPVSITVQQGPPPTNQPPFVKISMPANGAVFFSPVDIPICASAFDPDGYVATVEFFAGTQSLGTKTNNPASAGPMNPFCVVWSNVPPGTYSLTAVATDNAGAATTSDPVGIQVLPGPPPPTNYPPLVRLTSPPNGTVLRAPVNVPLYAYASDRDGWVTSVEFFAGTNSLGLGHGVCLEVVPGNWPGLACPTNFFVLVWSNAPAGMYVLSAVATDNGGSSATSGPVKLAILSPVPPPTNLPAIVSIVASDPLALEGTNCWPWIGLANTTPTWSDWTAASTSVWRFFTNCGPKNATFTLTRWGNTNKDLTVNYAIGGSATNGVDYVPLSGSVVIPAGQRHAQVDVVPLDDGVPDISSTVVLKLLGSTNYVLGYPQKAGVLILDGGRPRPFTGLLSDHTFHLDAPGPDGAWFHIEYSTNLMDWTAVCTNQVVNGSIDFVDPDPADNQSKFYRTVPEANPPPF